MYLITLQNFIIFMFTFCVSIQRNAVYMYLDSSILCGSLMKICICLSHSSMNYKYMYMLDIISLINALKFTCFNHSLTILIFFDQILKMKCHTLISTYLYLLLIQCDTHFDTKYTVRCCIVYHKIYM